MDEFLSEIEYNRLDDLLDTVCGSLSEQDQKFLRRRIPLRHPRDNNDNDRTSLQSQTAFDDSADGRDLAAVLRRSGVCDETQLGPLLSGLSALRRYDLLRIAYSHERKSVKTDPLEEFLFKETSKVTNENGAISSGVGSSDVLNANKRSVPGHDMPPHNEDNQDICGQQRKRRRTRNSRGNTSNTNNNDGNTSTDSYYSHSNSHVSSQSSVSPSSSSSSSSSAAASSSSSDSCGTTIQSTTSTQNDVGVRQRQTCDVRLRVWAEYCDHERVLRESVFSQKADAHERQLERFSQASSVLRSRDLGYIVCDIKFSEITYLDAFWRDYLNGSLLEALKGVFITESLKQAVGNEPIKLLVSIDEEDYEEGRQVLMNNVYFDHGRE